MAHDGYRSLPRLGAGQRVVTADFDPIDLAPGQAETLGAQDPSWMINGQRGVVQYVRGTGRDA